MLDSRVCLLEEPLLLFAEGQEAVDPRDGLTLFGPLSKDMDSHPQSPPYIVLGTPQGVALFAGWSAAMNQAAAVAVPAKHRLWPPYPGFEAAFGSAWAEKPTWTFHIDREPLIQASRKRDQHERAYAVVGKFMEGFEKSRKLDSPVAVAMCIVPDDVYKNCRTQSRVAIPSDEGISKAQKKSRQRGQGELFCEVDFDQYSLSPDFRRQLRGCQGIS